MALDYSPYFQPKGKNSYNDLVVVPSSNSSSSTASGIKYKNYTTNFDKPRDLYSTPQEAEERAYNLGCSGYRQVLIASDGQYKYSPCGTPQAYLDIMSKMPKKNLERKYYLFDQSENVFDVTNSINDQVYEGFEYRDQIFSRTLSSVIYLDPKKIPILDRYQRVVFALIESVKQIRNYFNYTVPFNNKRVF